MTTGLLRFLVILCGVVALVALTIANLGVLIGLLVLPIGLFVAAFALATSDPKISGRALARAFEAKADRPPQWRHVNRAGEFELAANMLEEFVDDDSADDEIERLRARADWERKRS